MWKERLGWWYEKQLKARGGGRGWEVFAGL